MASPGGDIFSGLLEAFASASAPGSGSSGSAGTGQKKAKILGGSPGTESKGDSSPLGGILSLLLPLLMQGGLAGPAINRAQTFFDDPFTGRPF